MATRRAENPIYAKLPMTPPRNTCRAITSSPISTGSTSASPSDTSSWRNSGGSSATEFEDICSISDSSSEIVPLKVSDSVKKLLSRSGARHGRPPSLSIPSPMAWSTLGAGQDSAMMLTASTIPASVPLSPTALAMLPSSRFGWKTPRCDTPSLDSSYNSAEGSSDNSPSTPISRSMREDTWDTAVQLQAKAMDVLFQLSPDFQHCDFGPMLHPPTPIGPEMIEYNNKMSTCRVCSDEIQDAEPLSAISVPSPGGFFASLGAVSQQVWGLSRPVEVVAISSEEAQSSTTRVEEVSSGEVAPSPTLEIEQDQPVEKSTISTSPIPDTDTSADAMVDEKYETVLNQLSASNTVRTKLWLMGQETYLNGLLSPHPVPDRCFQLPLSSSADQPQAAEIIPTSCPKKTVQFATATVDIPATRTQQKSDPLLYHTFQYLLRHSHPSDVYTQRHARLSALQTQRMHLPSAHLAFLRNTYILPAVPSRNTDNDFLHLPDAPTDATADALRDTIARATRERAMLQQVAPAVWQLQAWRAIHGGSFFTAAAEALISRTQRPRILDISTKPAAGWGWAVAVEYRNAQVSTVVPPGAGDSEGGWKLHREPSNHYTVPVANTWTFPFADASFDVVSARSLHTLCHASVAVKDKGENVDEWTATLAEIHRVLAPGGVFQFSLLDAEIKVKSKVHSPRLRPQTSSQAQPSSSSRSNSTFRALNQSFTSTLHTLKHNVTPIATFTSQLSRAGFHDAKHARLELPLTSSPVIDGCEGGAAYKENEHDDMGAIACLVGMGAYEGWVTAIEDEMRQKPLSKITPPSASASPSTTVLANTKTEDETPQTPSLLPRIALAVEQETQRCRRGLDPAVTPPATARDIPATGVEGVAAAMGTETAYIRMLVGCARKVKCPETGKPKPK